EGARAAIDAIKSRYPKREAVILMGVTKGKDTSGVTDIVNEIASRFVVIQASTSRAMAVEDLTEILGQYGKPVTGTTSIDEGIKTALSQLKSDELLLAIGSLYTVGDIRRYFGKI
ncbi:MAG: hypothetical protein FWG21_04705, partial [Oscillospiraceae bacterium]|nr:hypothetical protein [Oscillospiraceae bacterium]